MEKTSRRQRWIILTVLLSRRNCLPHYFTFLHNFQDPSDESGVARPDLEASGLDVALILIWLLSKVANP